jgi:putative FmdB family regulatory protein
MPIYDYRCLDCRRRVSLLYQTFSAAESATPICTNCGGGNLSRLVSRVALLKSEESRLDDMADPSVFGDIDENDPRSMARWARKMGDSLGEDMGDDFNEMIDRMEAGEMPDDDGDDFGGGGDDFGAGGDFGGGGRLADD